MVMPETACPCCGHTEVEESDSGTHCTRCGLAVCGHCGCALSPARVLFGGGTECAECEEMMPLMLLLLEDN